MKDRKPEFEISKAGLKQIWKRINRQRMSFRKWLRSLQPEDAHSMWIEGYGRVRIADVERALKL